MDKEEHEFRDKRKCFRATVGQIAMDCPEKHDKDDSEGDQIDKNMMNIAQTAVAMTESSWKSSNWMVDSC